MSAQSQRAYFPEAEELPAQRSGSYAAEIGQVALPEPIQALRDGGQISADEDALARRFYYEVQQSQLLPQLSDQAGYAQSPMSDPRIQEMDAQVRGIFALLNSVDEQLLGTLCALLLEMKLSGQDRPLPVEEVGRRIMGYTSQAANAAAGATLLRAALWIVRFGYQHPKLCQILLQEKQNTIEQDGHTGY